MPQAFFLTKCVIYNLHFYYEVCMTAKTKWLLFLFNMYYVGFLAFLRIF